MRLYIIQFRVTLLRAPSPPLVAPTAALALVPMPSGPTRSAAATPLWKAGHKVNSSGAAEVSRATIELAGGMRPVRAKGGTGSASAINGSSEAIVSIPRPTEHASDLREEEVEEVEEVAVNL